MLVSSLYLQHDIERIKQGNSYVDVVYIAFWWSIIIENYVCIKDIELLIDGDTIILLYYLTLALFAFKTMKNNIEPDWNNSTFEITQTKYL